MCNKVAKEQYQQVLKHTGSILEKYCGRQSRSTDVDDVIGMLGEETCNASGNLCANLFPTVML